MAYIIAKPTRYGTDAAYWKVCDLHFDLESKSLTFTLKGWASAQLRNTPGIDPLVVESITLTVDRFPALANVGSRTLDQIVGAIYNRVRELYPEWAAATDG